MTHAEIKTALAVVGLTLLSILVFVLLIMFSISPLEYYLKMWGARWHDADDKCAGYAEMLER